MQFRVECPSQNPKISIHDPIHGKNHVFHDFAISGKSVLSKKNDLPCDLRPNRHVQNDRISILSLQAVQQKVDFDCVFTMQIQLFHERPLFHLEPSEVCFYAILFSSRRHPVDNQEAPEGTQGTQEAPGRLGLKKWCTSQLKGKSSPKVVTLLCVFEGRTTKYFKFSKRSLPGSVTGAPHQPRPLSNTVRTPTAKDCLGN